ncbi:MAG: nucleotide sugar dehydrogenase [Roseomonas sp.]|nr:nucleotide sugar dehydrogenase [Roseomonas sp.]
MLPTNFIDNRVCIIGLGYVGLTLAVAMVDAGFVVNGVEKDSRILDALSEGRAHFSEAGLDARIASHLKTGRFRFSRQIPTDTSSTVYIVTVGTPVGPDKRTRTDSLRSVMDSIAQVLKEGDLVILRSTVRVGTTRQIVIPVLDSCGVKYDIAFCPERTLEGNALSELRSLPQVVGGRTSMATFRASQLFSFLTPSMVRVSSLEAAEMVKLINNTQRDYVFAFANEVAAMCDVLGISASEVISSGNLGYPRANLPLPGPVGGPCLEKDPYILAEGLDRFSFTPALALGARRWNEALPSWTVGLVAREYRRMTKAEPKKIAILGLAFKGRPETDDLRGTLAGPIIEMIRGEFPGTEIVGWDPVVAADAVQTLGVVPMPSLEMAFAGASMAFIQNNHPIFGYVDMATLAEAMERPAIIYDYWNQYQNGLTLPEGVSYRALGSFNFRSDM